MSNVQFSLCWTIRYMLPLYPMWLLVDENLINMSVQYYPYFDVKTVSNRGVSIIIGVQIQPHRCCFDHTVHVLAYVPTLLVIGFVSSVSKVTWAPGQTLVPEKVTRVFTSLNCK